MCSSDLVDPIKLVKTKDGQYRVSGDALVCGCCCAGHCVYADHDGEGGRRRLTSVATALMSGDHSSSDVFYPDEPRCPTAPVYPDDELLGMLLTLETNWSLDC